MNIEKYKQVLDEIKPYGARLVAVSKTKSVSDILHLYSIGQRIFGENKVQELTVKYEKLPKDIQWHLIGHLQTNKVKYIAPFVSVIQSVDSIKLLDEIDKQAKKQDRVIDCLLQVFIATEETKFGFSEEELVAFFQSNGFKHLPNVRLCGLMGLATNTDDQEKIKDEFKRLQNVFANIKQRYQADNPYFKELSMGMSSDYQIALAYGSTLIRIGSLIFGGR